VSRLGAVRLLVAPLGALQHLPAAVCWSASP
jgi:hypothetical protein